MCCFTSTETVGLLGTGAQDGHLDFHTSPELWLRAAATCIYIYLSSQGVDKCTLLLLLYTFNDPISSLLPIAAAGLDVTAAMTSFSGIPRCNSLVMTVGRSYAGPSTLSVCRSVLIRSGQNPSLTHASASDHPNDPEQKTKQKLSAQTTVPGGSHDLDLHQATAQMVLDKNVSVKRHPAGHMILTLASKCPNHPEQNIVSQTIPGGSHDLDFHQATAQNHSEQNTVIEAGHNLPFEAHSPFSRP